MLHRTRRLEVVVALVGCEEVMNGVPEGVGALGGFASMALSLEKAFSMKSGL